MPPISSTLPKVKRGNACRIAEADARDQQAEEERDDSP